MLSKLALRNAKRSIRDYLIYFITVIISFTMIISYNIVIYSEQVAEISHLMEAFRICVIVASIFVVFVIGWLIFYITNFMLDKRAKEFGLYMTLGIEQAKIRKLFITEFLFLNIISFLISFALGILFSNILTGIITNIYEYAFTVKPNVSFQAIAVSLLYFVIINLYIALKLNRKIRKQKIKDLLYLDKSNETKKFNIKKNIILVVFFLLVTIANTYYFVWMFSSFEKNISFVAVITILVCLIISIYGTTYYVIDLITYLLLNNKKVKYSNNNLFVIRQFSSKIKTIGMTLGTISVLIMVTLLSLNISNLFEQTYKNLVNLVQPFSVTTYTSPDNDDFSTIYDFINKHTKVKESIEYKIYTDGGMKYKCDNNKYNRSGQTYDFYVKLSDYNKLMKAIGGRTVSLDENQFIIHSDKSYKEVINEYLHKNKCINVNGKELELNEYIDKNMPECFALGASYIIIINDDLSDKLTPIHKVLSINTVDQFPQDAAKKFTEENKYNSKRSKEITVGESKIEIFNVVRLSIIYKNESNSMIVTITFCLIYLAIIFILVIGTIVSVQALYDSVKYKTRYTTLSYLGLTEDNIYFIIRKQLKLYYIYPVVFPLIISLVALKTVYDFLFSMYVDFSQFIINMATGFAIFFAIYILYYFVTYLQFKKNIL